MQTDAPDLPVAVLVNGKPSQTLNTRDRGLQYGDGLFETLAIVEGQARHWPLHMQRLAKGCEHLGLPVPPSLATESDQLCAGVKQGVLKIIVTRGVGGRGYRPPQPCHPSRYLEVFPWPDYPSANAITGVTIRLCETRLGINPALAGIKHLNRLEQVLARSEWQDMAIAEGLMRDVQGHIIEGTMSNLFIVKDGVLMTPDLSGCGVAGITRGRILALAAGIGLRANVRPLSLTDLRGADEVFLCNSLIGIWPVCRLLDTRSVQYLVGQATMQVKDCLTEG